MGNVARSREYEVGVYSLSDGGVTLETIKFQGSIDQLVGNEYSLLLIQPKFTHAIHEKYYFSRFAVSPEIIVVFSTLVTVAICLKILYAYYKYNYLRDPDCRYNFFEVLYII